MIHSNLKNSKEQYNVEVAGSECIRALILIGILGLEAILLIVKHS